MTKAVILAGSSQSTGETGNDFNKNKALVEIKGRPMLVYIVEALLQVKELEDIYVVGPKESLEEVLKGYELTILPEKGIVLDNILYAIENIKLDENENILLVTSDIPLITPQSISDFLSNCRGDYDLFYPVIRKETSEKKFNDLDRTYVKFKEGYFTGGNVFFINPRKVKQCYNILNKIISYRKKPVKLAILLGVTFVIKLFTGQLTIEQVEKKISELLNIEGKALITLYPELGTDVDKEVDMLWAENNIIKT